jgi:RHS repeat-associated protein
VTQTTWGNSGRFGYTGQAFIPELGLYYYKNRMYNPKLGRFMQKDPIGYAAGMNLYAYVKGDPVNFNDPLGLEANANEDIVVTYHKGSSFISFWARPHIFSNNAGTMSCNHLGCTFSDDIVITGRRRRRESLRIAMTPLPILASINILRSSRPDDTCGSDGTERVPDTVGGADLTAACLRHDRCYASSNAKATCDKRFFTEVKDACRQTKVGPLFCYPLGAVYYFGVAVGGGSAYQAAQRK